MIQAGKLTEVLQRCGIVGNGGIPLSLKASKADAAIRQLDAGLPHFAFLAPNYALVGRLLGSAVLTSILVVLAACA